MAELIAKKYAVAVKYVEWPEVEGKIESGDTVFDDEKLKECIGNTISMKFEEWINAQ